MNRTPIAQKIGLILCAVLVPIVLIWTFMAATALEDRTRQLSPSATIHYVAPGGNCDGVSPCYDTVQAAVDTAAPGEEILIASGTYSQVNNYGGLAQVVYIDKTIRIRGGYTVTNWFTSDPVANPTILDAQRQGRVAVISGAGVVAVLSGLTIQNGDATGLGGYLFNQDAGGGLYARSSSLHLRECRIVDNHSPDIAGALYYFAFDGSISLEECSVMNNEGSAFSSSVMIQFSKSADIVNSEISENDGTGIWLSSDDAMFEDNLVRENTGSGLAIRSTDTVAVLNNNIITRNDFSGLLVAENATFTMTNNIIASNHGRGISLSGLEDPYSNPLLIRGWLYHNTITENGLYGIRASGHVNLNLVNNILAGHSVAITTTTYSNGTPYVAADHTLRDGNGTYTDTSAGGVIVTTNDVFGDPAFVGGADYHITSPSAAVDAGVDLGIAVDMDGDPRPVGNAPDIGADELFPVLSISYGTGAPGSYFTLVGSNFPPSISLMLSVNNTSLGMFSIDASGTFTVLLSTGNADEGKYFATTSAHSSPTLSFVLNSGAATRPQEGLGPIFDLPAGIAFTETMFLPTVMRE